jgi:hypothetical protein
VSRVGSCGAGLFFNQSIGVTGRDAKAEGPQHLFLGGGGGQVLLGRRKGAVPAGVKCEHATAGRSSMVGNRAHTIFIRFSYTPACRVSYASLSGTHRAARTLCRATKVVLYAGHQH